jgi:hypothetical protein
MSILNQYLKNLYCVLNIGIGNFSTNSELLNILTRYDTWFKTTGQRYMLKPIRTGQERAS